MFWFAKVAGRQVFFRHSIFLEIVLNPSTALVIAETKPFESIEGHLTVFRHSATHKIFNF